MRQDGERSVGNQSLPTRAPARRRGVPCGRLATSPAMILLALASWASANDDDGPVPDLAKPNEMKPIVSTPTGPKPAVTPSGRAVLALPGITRPLAPKPITVAPPISSTPIDDEATGSLRLDAPLEMKGSPTEVTPLPRVSPGRSSRPLVLESTTDEPLSIDAPASRTNPEAKRSTTILPRVDPQASPLLSKRGRFFGLFPGPAPAPAPASASATALKGSVAEKSERSGRAVVEGPMADPSVESALKRRIEKQAREAVGDRARAIEVKVVGKSATVQARGVKLFQKRNVRKSLESIPALTGIRATIDVLD